MSINKEHRFNSEENKISGIPKEVKIEKIINIFSEIHPLSKIQLEELREKCLEREKASAYNALEHAKKYIIQLKFDEAINLLLQITDKFPQEALFHSYLGLAMQRKGWTGYSQAEFKVALHYNPQEQIALQFYTNPEDNFKKFSENQPSLNEQIIKYYFD